MSKSYLYGYDRMGSGNKVRACGTAPKIIPPAINPRTVPKKQLLQYLETTSYISTEEAMNLLGSKFESPIARIFKELVKENINIVFDMYCGRIRGIRRK